MMDRNYTPDNTRNGVDTHNVIPLVPPNPWAKQLIDRAGTGPAPAYGSPEWHALPDGPVKVAACVRAAECWRYESDPAVIAWQSRVELAFARREADADLAALIRTVAAQPTHAELERRRGRDRPGGVVRVLRPVSRNSAVSTPGGAA